MMKLKRRRIHTIIKLLYCFIVFCGAFFLFTKTSNAEGANAIVSGDIIINEVYPNPDPESCDLSWCEDEWIELANLSDGDIILTGYTVEDLNIFNKKIDDPDHYNPIELDIFTISAHSLLLLEKDKFSFALNNDNEKIVLRKDTEIINEFSYGTIDGVKQLNYGLVKGQSYAFFGTDGWKLTTSPTYGEENIFTDIKAGNQEESNDPIDISSARSETNGTAVTITGTVTVLPGTLSSQYFYIQDATGGMQIYSYYKNFPELQIGDIIQVSGELSETSGERRLKMNADTIITVLSHETAPLPKPVEIADIGENLEGQYVKITGTVTETSGDIFVVADNAGHSIKVVIKSMTNIDKPKMKKGDQVEVIGIVSQYKDDYRILPIDQDDVKIISPQGNAPLAETGMTFFFYPVFSFIIMLIWNTFQKVRMKLTTSQINYLPNLLPATFML